MITDEATRLKIKEFKQDPDTRRLHIEYLKGHITEDVAEWFRQMDLMESAIREGNATDICWHKDRVDTLLKDILRCQWLIIGEKAVLNNTPATAGRSEEWQIDKAREYPFHELHLFGRQHGKIRVGLCPFHAEKSGSFTLYDNNTAHCFGCGWHGDPIQFVMDRDRLTFPEAIRRLQ